MHQQVRVSTALSPPNLGQVLKIVADAGFNILAVGGSDLEHGGELGFAVDHDRQQAVVDLLREKGYEPRIVDVMPFWLTKNEPGQLLACIQQVAAANKTSGKAIRDIAIGPPDKDGRIPIQIYSARRA